MTIARIAPRTRSLLGAAFVGAALLLAAAPTEALAADIVVKSVKIKKRNSSILRKGGAGAEGRFTVGELSITTTTTTRHVGEAEKVEGGRISQATAAFAFAVAAKDGAVVTGAALDLTLTDCKGATRRERVAASAGEAGFTAQLKMPEYSTCPWQLSHETILITDANETERTYESTEEVPQDRCAAEFTMKGVGFTATTVAPKEAPATLELRFDFVVGPVAPTRTDMLVQLTNCEGEKKVVRAALEGVDGRFTGSASLAQVGCPWVLTYGEVYADGPCGAVDTWAIDFTKAIKVNNLNGTGTRSGAASTKGAKPALK